MLWQSCSADNLVENQFAFVGQDVATLPPTIFEKQWARWNQGDYRLQERNANEAPRSKAAQGSKGKSNTASGNTAAEAAGRTTRKGTGKCKLEQQAAGDKKKASRKGGGEGKGEPMESSANGEMDSYMQAITNKAYYAKKKADREGGGHVKTRLLASKDKSQKDQALMATEHEGERVPQNVGPKLSRAREAIRTKREADLAPKSWQQFDDEFDHTVVSKVNKRELLQQKVLELQRIHLCMTQIATADSMEDDTVEARISELQRFEAMTKQEVSDLRRALGVLGA